MTMRMRRRNICVFIETGEDFTAKVSSLMLLSHARILADRNRGKLTAVIIGGHQDETILREYYDGMAKYARTKC